MDTDCFINLQTTDCYVFSVKEVKMMIYTGRDSIEKDISSGYVYKYLFVSCHDNLYSGLTIFSLRFASIVSLYFQSNKCRIKEGFYFAIFFLHKFAC